MSLQSPLCLFIQPGSPVRPLHHYFFASFFSGGSNFRSRWRSLVLKCIAFVLTDWDATKLLSWLTWACIAFVLKWDPTKWCWYHTSYSLLRCMLRESKHVVEVLVILISKAKVNWWIILSARRAVLFLRILVADRNVPWLCFCLETPRTRLTNFAKRGRRGQDNQLSKYPFLVPTCRIRGQTDTYTGFAEAQAFLIIKSSLNE